MVLHGLTVCMVCGEQTYDIVTHERQHLKNEGD